MAARTAGTKKKAFNFFNGKSGVSTCYCRPPDAARANFCLHMDVRGGHLPLQASGRSPKGMAEGKRWSCSALEMLQIQLAAQLSHNGGVSHSMSVWSSSASVGCLRAGDDELSAS